MLFHACSGYLSVWELFSTDIQNFTAYAPFMMVDGNHERDYPQSGAPCIVDAQSLSSKTVI